MYVWFYIYIYTFRNSACIHIYIYTQEYIFTCPVTGLLLFSGGLCSLCVRRRLAE